MKLFVLLLSCVLIHCKESLIRLPRIPDEGQPITKKSNGRIIGGAEAGPRQYPWTAAIYKTTPDGRFFCGGSIISQLIILTAAQCVYNATQFSIQVGSNTLTGNDSNRVTVTATRYLHEPRFDPTVSLAHDIGLIRLDEPLTLNDYIKPIIYATFGWFYPDHVMEVVGWGQSSDSDSDLMENLHYVNVSVIDQLECQTLYGSQVADTMICAVGSVNEGFCYGDIGGPVVGRAMYDGWVITLAIPSWMSQNGCESSDPNGLTRIDSYYSWVTAAIVNDTWSNF